MSRARFLVAVAFAAWAVSSAAAPTVARAAGAPVPVIIDAQGVLRDGAGVPKNGTLMLTFTLYDAPSAGTMLYQEAQMVPVTQGIFATSLGTLGMSTIDPAIFATHSDVYLGVQIVGDAAGELPRQKLVATPFAFQAEHANDADSLGGAAASAYQHKLANGCTTGTFLVGAAVDGTPMCATPPSVGLVGGTGVVVASMSGNFTLSADTTVLQARLGTPCAAGNAIRQINLDGTVVCEPVPAGDITGVTAGTGLTGGGASGALTVAVDPTQVQTRLSASCAAGSAIRQVNQDGTVVCEPIPPGDITGVITGGGTGLTGGASGGDVSLSLISCPVGQVLKFSFAGWMCAVDNNTGTIAGITTGAASGLTGGVAAGNANLGLLSCATGQLLKFTTGTGWACAADADSGGDITAVVTNSGITGGSAGPAVALGVDFSQAQARVIGTCAAGSSIRTIDATGAVTCQTDNVGTSSGGIPSVSNGTNGGLTVTNGSSAPVVALVNCGSNEILKFNSATTSWACAADTNSGGTVTSVSVGAAGGFTVTSGTTTPVISLVTCATGQLLKFNGASWACAADLDTNSGGTVTSVAAGATGGITITNPTTTPAIGLITSCATNQLLKFNGAAWACAADNDSGDILAVNPGTGMTGGGASGAVTLNVNPTVIQTRIADSCPVGQAIQAIDSAGNVTCTVDQVSAGGGGVSSVTAGATGGLAITNGTTAPVVGLAACANGQILKFSGSAWICAADVDNGGTVTSVSAGATGGLSVSNATTTPVIGLIACTNGQLLKLTAGAWACATDANGGGTVTNVTAAAGGGLAVATGTTTPAIGLITSCTANQTLKFIGGAWACADDVTGLSGDITSVTVPAGGTGGLTGGATSGDVTISLLSCPVGQTLKSIAAASWGCAADNDTGGTITAVGAGANQGITATTAGTTVSLSMTTCGVGQFLDFDMPSATWRCTGTAMGTGTSTGGSPGVSLVWNVLFGGSGGDLGTANSVSRGDHLHDTRYFTSTALTSAGTINTATNPVDWTKLKNVPASLADGIDNDSGGTLTGLSAGSGILVGGTATAPTLGLITSCADGQILKSAAGAWSCGNDLVPGSLSVPKANQVSTHDAGPQQSGTDASLTIGSDGLPIIAYQESSSTTLRVAHCNDTTCASSQIVTVDASASTGHGASIAVGTDGFPVISYVDTAAGTVKVVHCTAVDCSTHGAPAVSGAFGAIGLFTAIAVPPTGLPTVVFALSSGILHGLNCTSATCSALASDFNMDGASGVADGGISLAMMPDGFPMVAYVGSASAGVRWAKCTQTTCNGGISPVIVDSTGKKRPSLTLGTDGFPIFSYVDGSNHVKVAHCVNATCAGATNVSSVDTSGTDGALGTAISLNPQSGLASIAYRDTTTARLRVATCNNQACTTASVAITAATGGDFCSMSFGTDGLPIIAEQSPSLDLEVVHCANPYCAENWSRR